MTEPVAEDGRANETDFGRLLILVRGALKLLRPVIPVDIRGTFVVVVVQTSEEPWIVGTCDEPVGTTPATFEAMAEV